MMTIGPAFAILLTLTAQAEAPSPGQAKGKAQALLNEGTALYQRGSYAQALEKFHSAYAAYPSPKLWFNIGKANRELGNQVEALEAFERYLSEVPGASSSTEKEAVAALDDLKRKLGQLRIDCDLAGAEISIDGKFIGRAPLSGPTWVTAGRRDITAIHPTRKPSIRQVEVVPGELRSVTMLFAAEPTPAPPPPVAVADVQAREPKPVDATSGGRRWTWVAAGAAVVFAGGAATLGLLNQSKYDDLNKTCGSASETRPGCEEGDIDGLRARQLTASVLWGVAGAAALTSVVLFFVESDEVTVAPTVGQTTGLMASGRF